jgi:hypothetical protein
MTTTIQFITPADTTPRSNTTKHGLLYARSGFGILMLWAVVMLSIGAAAHFGAQSSEFTAFELLAPL